MKGNLKKIGWIGTGVMGKSMCKHLINKGYELSVFTRTMSKAEELIKMGAKTKSPEEIAKTSDAVFLMLGYPHDVESIVLGNNGILRHMPKGSYLVDHTTSSPDLATQIYNKYQEKGIISFDAPVSGGDVGARNGKLIVMVGGDEKHLSQPKNVMEAYSAKVEHFGAAGKGQHTKMVNQTIIASTIIAVCEGLIYGHKAGLDLNKVIELLSGGAAGSFTLSVYGPRILKRDFEPGFYIEHFFKDLEISLKECENMKIDLKGLKLAHKFYKAMIEEGYGRKGIQALYLALEKMNKIENKL